MLAAEAYALEDAGVVFGVGGDAGELKDLKVGKEPFYFIVEPDLFDTAAAVGEQYPPSEGTEDVGEVRDCVPAEDQFGRGMVNKVFHKDSFLV